MTDMSPLLRDVARFISDALPALNERRYDIIWKADGSPVTAADVYLEEGIAALLHQRIGDLAFIGEESWTAGMPIHQEWRAVLDPIDGTENFCSGLKEWGTSLSLWRGEKHAGSLLMLPELGDVMLSGDIARVPRSRIVGFSSSWHQDIGEGLAATPEGRIMGCAVYNLFNVIRGAFARFVNPKGARSWDLLAGVALAREAGCDITINDREYHGRFLEPDQRYRVDIRHRYDLHPG
ncbi:MAG: inositol monophosphatase family protein [Sphingobium sp.]